MGRSKGTRRPGETEDDWPTEEVPLRRPPQPGFSRIDTLPEDFFRTLGQRQLVVGEIIGERYRLIERLGSGAMGDVYVAENLTIGLRVAVKLVKPELLNDAIFRHRFQREAEAIAAISHSNVARFLDLVIGDPTFLVMEYVPGPTVASRLRQVKWFPADRAATITLTLCHALRATHAAGVVHRDLKPLNVILTPDPDQGETPKLIDFGLAKIGQKPIDTALTHAGQLVGTPNYMSPEQIAGKEVDGRSDVYSLGCLMFEMLTGRPPFVSKEAMRVLYMHVNDPVPSARGVRAEVPAALDEVATRALAKDPALRFASMSEFGEALERALRPRPVASPLLAETSGTALLRGRRRRRSTVPLVAVASLLIMMAGFAGYAIGALGRLGRRGGGTLLVATEPAGAELLVDGRRAAETTPTAVAGLAEGWHVVSLRRKGLATVERRVELRRDERQLVEVVLPPPTRQIEVRSVPSQAKVYLDGRLVLGETPTTVSLLPDFHELRFEKDGYETASEPITPDDERAVVQATLEPERMPRGSLSIESNVIAEVWLDGVYTGFATPTVGLRASVGAHTVELHANGMRSAGQRIAIHKGQNVRVFMPLVPEAGLARPR